MEWFVAMLGGVGGEGVFEEGEKKALQDLGSGAKEGDRTIGAAGFRGFARLEERNDCGGFPNGGDV